MIYIGIDPGEKGTMAILEYIGDERENITIIPYDKDAYAKNLAELSRCSAICCLDRVSAMPKQGVVSMFNFGKNFGFIQGLLTAYSIPYEIITPQKWKKEFQITGDKNSSIAVCKRLFPDVDLRRTERYKKDDDGMAEAVLLAEYARRKL